MPDFEALSLGLNLALFLLAAGMITIAGWRMAKVADRLADRTGLGEAVIGAVLLGGSTSLADIMASVVAAAENYPELAVSNALGGVAAQTAFLAVVDLTYRRANLEHAAASSATLMQAALLCTLLTIPLLAGGTPDVVVLGVHPATILLVVIYVYGIVLVSRAGQSPMWSPARTRETIVDVADETARRMSLRGLLAEFVILALLLGSSGWLVAQTGIAVSVLTGLSETAVGALMTAVATSLPELVTGIAAVRQGALTLAVSGIIGGNAFDTLLVALSDIAYRGGSIYHVLTPRQTYLVALTIFLTGVALMGFIRREKFGLAGIGLEGVVILVGYTGGMLLLVLA